eukprot:TRINITY_DN8620_c2_g1_i1.p1 TRINITY_DN8620_c2_g1~~TRINITY_DN8620_c2_g1_i1.p1  ORF type:complete len:405 (+),score=40.87 TRINITY_DN8620_c2_g1_i1:116-1216(+)
MVASSRSGLCLREHAQAFAKKVSAARDHCGRHQLKDGASSLSERVVACDEYRETLDSEKGFKFLVSQSTCCESSDLDKESCKDSASGSESGFDDYLLPNTEPVSPSPSLLSSRAWFRANETVVFLDFDDTLFPSTWLAQVVSIRPGCTPPSIDALRDRNSAAVVDLARHEAAVISFLRAVTALAGEVVIVTLGTREWVESCMRSYMPELLAELSKLNIRLSYARETLNGRRVRGAILEGMDALPILKRESMRKALKQFYSQRPKQSWKNCISIGDSRLERDALEELTFTRQQRTESGKQKFVRCKTIKFLSSPSLESLTSQIELMISYISALVYYDGDFSYDIHDNDDMEAMRLHESLSRGTFCTR